MGLSIIRKCFLVLKRAFIFEYLLFRGLQARLRLLCQGDSLFRNTNVVLLGPNTDFDYELEERIKCADIVAVVNKSYRTSFAKKSSKVAKKFIVFHCMDQREDVGGGQIEVSVLCKCELKLSLYPCMTRKLISIAGSFTGIKVGVCHCFVSVENNLHCGAKRAQALCQIPALLQFDTLLKVGLSRFSLLA